jgi:hypothetical protein
MEIGSNGYVFEWGLYIVHLLVQFPFLAHLFSRETPLGCKGVQEPSEVIEI